MNEITQIEYLFPETFDVELMANLRPLAPFENCIVDMLNILSQSLLKDRVSRLYPDVVTFAFFCRKANLLKLQEEYLLNDRVRLGRGVVFHIAPSNVPINFGYSLVAGLLSGNVNIVRISSKPFPQVDLIIKHLKQIAVEHPIAKERIAIVRYEHTSNANEVFSALCHVRVIWGGDKTIATLRNYPTPPRALDICFADRYSIAALNANALVNEENIGKLAEQFYNDTYLFDQNACSAPHLVLWTGTEENIIKAKEIFWKAVHQYASIHYANFQDVMAVDKLTTMYLQAVDLDVKDESYETNILRRVNLQTLPLNIDNYRCAGGYFAEYSAKSLEEMVPIIKNKYQTLAYYGYDREMWKDFVLKNRMIGVDRIVPIGETTAFSLTWDGYNLIDQLTRIVSII